jgi:hypothetical protein
VVKARDGIGIFFWRFLRVQAGVDAAAAPVRVGEEQPPPPEPATAPAPAPSDSLWHLVVGIHSISHPKLYSRWTKPATIRSDLNALYTFTPTNQLTFDPSLPDGHVDSDMIISVDPAGTLPSSLVNMFAKFNSMELGRILQRCGDSGDGGGPAV